MVIIFICLIKFQILRKNSILFSLRIISLLISVVSLVVKSVISQLGI